MGKTCSARGRIENRYAFLKGNSERMRDYLESLCVDDKIIIKWILEEGDEIVWTGFIWLRIRLSGALL
jgi:hypothetical protein